MLDKRIEIRIGDVFRCQETGNRWIVEGYAGLDSFDVQALDGGSFGGPPNNRYRFAGVSLRAMDPCDVSKCDSCGISDASWNVREDGTCEQCWCDEVTGRFVHLSDIVA